MSVISKGISVFVLAATLSVAAEAQEPGHLEVTTLVEKEEVTVDAAGREVVTRIPATTVVPGERVFYTTTFRNIGSEPAENVVITSPIADSLTYIDGSAAGNGLHVQFSVDGGRTFADPAELTVVEDGVERPAVSDDYTHVRWSLSADLAAGAEGSAGFAAVLD